MIRFCLVTIILLLLGVLTCLVLLLLQPTTLPQQHINPREAATPRKIWNISFSNQNLSCLSEAIFHEAGTEPNSGKEAVGVVILNRAEEKSTQNLCSVVHESSVVNGKRICQFSYYCLPLNKRFNPISGLNWADCVFISVQLLNNKITDDVSTLVANATYFHAEYVHPAWAKNKHFLAKIGTHLFYSEK